MQDWRRRNTKSACQKGEGEGRHDESQQEASLFAECQTTGRGFAAGFVHQESAVKVGCCKRSHTLHALKEEHVGVLTSKSVHWFRFPEC